jgi:amidophosphoribosyltransferase
VYDVTYGVVRPNIDRVVAIDDSIVRGTTLQKSIITMLNRLEPKEIIIGSTAPQIRYPDCYGIDMAKLEEFIAFQAAIALLKERHQDKLIKYVYDKCKEQDSLSDDKLENYVSLIYKPFTDDEITRKIEELVTPLGNKTKLTIIFQTLEGLHKVLTENKGDWYFTGDFPTIGGYRIINNAFINYYEGRDQRAYS